MRGLRAKIAAIIIASTVAVVLVATAITAFVLTSGEATRMVGPVARQIVLTTQLQGDDPQRPMPPPPPPDGRRFGPNEITATLPQGEAMPLVTNALQQELAAEGETRKVSVIKTAQGQQIAAFALEDGKWMLFTFPRAPVVPPSLLVALVSWLGLVVVGVVGVALLVAGRVTRSFAVLERTVAAVGADGVLPHTPETGSGEMRQMARVLNGLSDRVKAAMESRMRLVAAAGHDLRTPMTRMRLRAEFLSDEDRHAWLADLEELEAIADSAIRLVREEGAGADHSLIALDALVRDTATELAQAGLPVKLGTVAAAQVAAGPLALRRALRNLITNAATHGGGARVQLERGEQGAVVIIEDDGPGIPDALIGQVFEPFFRANPARTQTIKGAGLGLAIAREIIERFGGTIEISNRAEGGLRQTVTLRLAEG